MNCPGIDTLEAGGPPALAHLEVCGACRSIAGLMQVSALSSRPGDCARAELLIAAGAASPLGVENGAFLPEHLRRCSACREIALEPPTAEPREAPPIDPEHYALGVEIGRGGMGRVLAARDLRIGRAVALKEMLATDAVARARFEREARITARLQHPGIVSVYEVGRWPDGRPFYAMPILPGRTLGQAIAAAPVLPARLRLVPTLIAAADAVAYAHSRGVIHRDLTPSNILLGSFGETIVIDWGVAKQLDETEAAHMPAGSGGAAQASAALTVQGAVIGTPAYIAPEQADGRPVDERADVYALGAIMHQVLTGRPPYSGTSAQVLAALRDRRQPAAMGPRVPRDLRSIVHKAMAAEPEARYPSAGALVEELRRYQAGERVVAHRYTRREVAARWLSKRLPVVAVSSVLLTLLAGTAVWGGARLLRERQRADQSTSELRKVRASLEATKPTSGELAIKGWYRSGANPQNYDMDVEKDGTTWQGKPSVALRAIDSRADGYGTLAQMILANDYRGKRVRLSGMLKTNEATRAVLWLRIDAPGREQMVLDNMYERPVTGTTDWGRHHVVLDVPMRAAYLAFGVMLSGGGTVWASDLKLEIVDDTVALTVTPGTGGRPLPRNLDFSAPWPDPARTTPAGWERYTERPDDFQLTSQPRERLQGKPVVHLRSQARPRTAYYLIQNAEPAAYRGKRVRISAQLRTEGLKGWAALWAQSEDVDESLGTDNPEERGVRGTTAWSRHGFVLDVPPDAGLLSFGLVLTGPGHLAIADFKIETVDHTVPVTLGRQTAPRNLDFTE